MITPEHVDVLVTHLHTLKCTCSVKRFRFVNMLVDFDGRISSEIGGSEGREVTSTIVLYLSLGFLLVSHITGLRVSF
jgi:hypothetical protein